MSSHLVTKIDTNFFLITEQEKPYFKGSTLFSEPSTSANDSLLKLPPPPGPSSKVTPKLIEKCDKICWYRFFKTIVSFVKISSHCNSIVEFIYFFLFVILKKKTFEIPFQ